MPSELIDKLRLELRRGSLTIAVLAQLRAEHYGYAAQGARGLGLEIDEGTLYPLLAGSSPQGLLTSGGARRSARSASIGFRPTAARS
jgi:PadR family transcriptional regulator PadR